MVYRAFRTGQNKGAAAGMQATRCPESLGAIALVPRDQLGGGGVLETSNLTKPILRYIQHSQASVGKKRAGARTRRTKVEKLGKFQQTPSSPQSQRNGDLDWTTFLTPDKAPSTRSTRQSPQNTAKMENDRGEIVDL